MKTEKKEFEYFRDYFKPIGNEWSKKDLIRHKNWYYSIVNYIDNFVDLKAGDGKIFEIGSGIGPIMSIYSDRGFECIGSDISIYILERAKKLSPTIPFILCDIEKSTEMVDTFDYVLGFEVLEHLNRLDKAISNIHSILNENGYFIGTTPYPFSKNMIDPTHVNVKHPMEWKKLLSDAGFKEVLTKPMSFIPFIHRLNKKFNIVIPIYTSIPKVVSTTLIVAKKE